MEIQQDMYPGESVRELQCLSDTRWACRYAACKTVVNRLPAVMQLLSELESGDNAKRAVEAKALLNFIDSHFVLMLVLTCDVFGHMQSLSVMLQSSSVDFAAATNLINVIHTDLADFRSGDDHFSNLCTDAISLFESCDIECGVLDNSISVSGMPPARKCKLPPKLADSHVLETVGNRPDTCSRHFTVLLICV